MLSASGFRDGLGERDLQFDRETGEIRERLFLRPELAAYESALRRRIGRLASIADPRLVPVHGIEHDRASGKLAVLSQHAPGTRLDDILRSAREHEIIPDLTVGLFLAAEILAAAHTFHSLSGLPHGAIAPQRVVIAQEGDVLLTDYAYAEVIEASRFSPARLWDQFGIAHALGDPYSFDGDVRQSALIAIALMLGRPIETLEVPDGLDALVIEVEEAAMIRGGRLFAEPVIGWLTRAIGAGSVGGFRGADEASDACLALLTERERSSARSAVLQFLLELETAEPIPSQPPSTMEAAPAAVSYESTGSIDAFDTFASSEAEALELEPSEPEPSESEPSEPLRPVLVYSAPDREPERQPEPEPDVEPEPEPAAQEESVPQYTWQPEPEPEPEPEPAMLATDAEMASPEPEVAAAPEPVFVAFEPGIAPAALGEREPIEPPIAEAEVEAEPEIEPQSEPEPEPLPAYEPEPEPVAVFTSPPAPEPVLEPEPITFASLDPIPQPKPDPFSQLDGLELSNVRAKGQPEVVSSSPFSLFDLNTPPRRESISPPAPPPAQPPPKIPTGFMQPPPVTPLSPPTPAPSPFGPPISLAPPAPPPSPFGPPISLAPPRDEEPETPRVSAQPAAIRLKDTLAVKKPPTAPPPRVDMPSERPTPAFDRFEPEEPTSTFRIPWKMVAAAVVVIATGFAALNLKWSGTSPAGASAPGTLVVETTPPGSEIFIDGDKKGVTPAVLQVTPGRHEMKLTRKGAEHAWSVDVASGARRVERLDWTALRRTGGIEVMSNTPGSKVLVDGKVRGVTPLVIEDLNPGRHLVVVQGPNGNVRRRVTVVAGETTKLDLAVYSGWIIVSAPIELKIVENGKQIATAGEGPVVLSAGTHTIQLVNEILAYRSTHTVDISPGEEERLNIVPKGRVNLNAVPWAEVFIDGERVGETPIANLSVTIGAREILFKHPEHGERQMAVTVTGGEPLQISVDLTKPPSP